MQKRTHYQEVVFIKVVVIDTNPLEGLAYEHLFKTQLAEMFPNLQYMGQGFTAKQGLELLRAHQPEIVFTDVLIPDVKRNLELIVSIREASPRSAIVITTTVEDFRLLHGALRMGVHHYYLKPISLSKLKTILLSIESRLGLLHKRKDMQQASQYQGIISRFLSASEAEIEGLLAEAFELFEARGNASIEATCLEAINFASEIYFSPAIQMNQQAFLSSTYNQLVRQISESTDLSQLKQCMSIYLQKSARIIKNEGQSTGIQDVETAIRLIEHYVKLEEDFSLESIAREIYISPYYLSHLFKQVNLRNFSDVVIDTRVEYAKKLLSDSEESILEISARCGYSEPNSFRRIFRVRTGFSPSEYRKAMPEKR